MQGLSLERGTGRPFRTFETGIENKIALKTHNLEPSKGGRSDFKDHCSAWCWHSAYVTEGLTLKEGTGAQQLPVSAPSSVLTKSYQSALPALGQSGPQYPMLCSVVIHGFLDLLRPLLLMKDSAVCRGCGSCRAVLPFPLLPSCLQVLAATAPANLPSSLTTFVRVAAAFS